MAPSSFEEFLVPAPQIARTRGPEPNLVAKFALFVGTGGLMLGFCRRHQLDLAFQVYLSTNLITFILGLVLMKVSMVSPPNSTATRNGKMILWVTLFMAVVTLALGSFLLMETDG
ncbi:hypothetical protein COCNU_03G004510 [Cocos nucifera]|uniref:Uncharacterized protein n=1 Tax=Cocos nucifera TaxID=13894 RepID=A0A8K0MY12_COCNU|nr:hypothetical protein COCNU_03G004510 [Cocos nucifera]